mmetsp:Transcript_21258/g.54038  ORF Transcript_21258/g.54038 Transcript_21258/m.54038 type:complete len:454 (+) Transcript_21258:532-1893(+)
MPLRLPDYHGAGRRCVRRAWRPLPALSLCPVVLLHAHHDLHAVAHLGPDAAGDRGHAAQRLAHGGHRLHGGRAALVHRMAAAAGVLCVLRVRAVHAAPHDLLGPVGGLQLPRPGLPVVHAGIHHGHLEPVLGGLGHRAPALGRPARVGRAAHHFLQLRRQGGVLLFHHVQQLRDHRAAQAPRAGRARAPRAHPGGGGAVDRSGAQGRIHRGGGPRAAHPPQRHHPAVPRAGARRRRPDDGARQVVAGDHLLLRVPPAGHCQRHPAHAGRARVVHHAAPGGGGPGRRDRQRAAHHHAHDAQGRGHGEGGAREAAARGGRQAAAGAGAVQPGGQRGQVHGQGQDQRQGVPRPRRAPRDGQGGGHGVRHPQGQAARHLPGLPAGRHGQDAQAWRRGPGPVHRQGAGALARRAHLRAQRGRGRRHLSRPQAARAAAGDGRAAGDRVQVRVRGAGIPH